MAMQRGVAAAMQYLSSFAFVHRALSAHSVLVNSHLVCKVARLGHSPQVRAQPWGLCILQQQVLEDEPEPGAGGGGRCGWDLGWHILVFGGLGLTCAPSRREA